MVLPVGLEPTMS